MPKAEITYEIAQAASYDAANRNMKAAGRGKWNVEDYQAAAEEFNRLWPNEMTPHDHVVLEAVLGDI